MSWGPSLRHDARRCRRQGAPTAPSEASSPLTVVSPSSSQGAGEAPQKRGDAPRAAELSSRTFWSFAGECSSFGRQGSATESGADLGHGSACPSGDPAILFSRAVASRRTGRGFRWSADGEHAAASLDGHVPHAADRLASARARRAAAARAVRSAGTASPLPKYISSGVCPRNAECGSTRLCSWT